MSDDRQTPQAVAPRRWPKVLLAISLVFNLVVIGAVVGANLRHEQDTRRFPPPDPEMTRGLGVAPLLDALPREARRDIGARLRAELGGVRPHRDRLEAEFAAMLEALRADPFEPAALAAMLEAQQARVAGRVAAGRAVFLEALGEMSPAERAAFADRLEARMTRGPRMPH